MWSLWLFQWVLLCDIPLLACKMLVTEIQFAMISNVIWLFTASRIGNQEELPKCRKDLPNTFCVPVMVESMLSSRSLQLSLFKWNDTYCSECWCHNNPHDFLCSMRFTRELHSINQVEILNLKFFFLASTLEECCQLQKCLAFWGMLSNCIWNGSVCCWSWFSKWLHLGKQLITKLQWVVECKANDSWEDGEETGIEESNLKLQCTKRYCEGLSKRYCGSHDHI